MQLATRSGEPDHKASPTMSAALIDSLFEAHSPLLTGVVFSGIAASLTALKTGEPVIWACVTLLVLAGVVRSFDFQRYQARKSTMSARDAARWQKRYQIGAMIQAAAIGLWCSLTLLSNDDAVAHMIALSVTAGMVAGGAGRAYGRQWIFQLQAALIFGPTVIALALHGTAYYIAMSVVCAAFLVAVIQISANLHRIFLRAVVAREREAALAGQFDTALNNMPHGLCMFRADGTSRRDEPPLQRDDEICRTAWLSERWARPISSTPASSPVRFRRRAASIILAEIEDSQARDIITTDPDIARGRSLSWTFQPMAGGGAVVLVEDITERRNAEARISHLARYDELTALPNRVNFRDEIERLLNAAARGRPAFGAAVRRSRPVQAGQRHARPSLRRPVAVRWSPSGCARCCGPRISWRASAATSSWCSSRTSAAPRRPPAWRGASSTI